MSNYNDVTWKSGSFYNACTVRSLPANRKYDCFNQPWYEENYRKRFFEYIISEKNNDNAKAKSILDECSECRQYFSPEVNQYFEELLENWYVNCLSKELPVRRSTSLITAECMPGIR